MRVKYKYVVKDISRHGQIRIYYKRQGCKKIRLAAPINSPEFLLDYAAVLRGETPPSHLKKGKEKSIYNRAKGGSFRWLCEKYKDNLALKNVTIDTYKRQISMLERLCLKIGDVSYLDVKRRHIVALRDSYADKIGAANNVLRVLKSLCNFAVEYEYIEINPATSVKKLKPLNPDGFHTWTLSEIAQFEEFHNVGTTPRLAFDLLLFTGQRRSDVVRLGKQFENKGRLEFVQEKGKKTSPSFLSLPIIPQLQKSIDATKTGDTTYLITSFNKPYTSNGFGNSMRKWCDLAALPKRCASHGLRKAAATRLAESGCSEHEIMAWTGHKTSDQVNIYTRKANQKLLSDAAILKTNGK